MTGRRPSRSSPFGGSTKVMPGGISTGHVLEQMVRAALRAGGYTLENDGRQVVVGRKPNGTLYKADVVAVSPAGHRYIISLKWQQTPGTAEEKVPYEVISLMHILRTQAGAYRKAYLVLGGPGWSLREFYVSGGLRPYIAYEGAVDIVDFERFVAMANSGAL